MKIAIITLTEQGLITAQRIKKSLKHSSSIYIPEKAIERIHIPESDASTQISRFSVTLHQLVSEIFGQFNGLVFVMAIGIVMRVISPNIKDKHNDPAVVTVDDVGRYVISVLAGHEGGANKLAHYVAATLCTDAVITTGTEAKKDIIIGIGCKKGISSEAIKNSIKDALQNINISIERVRLLSTVDIKAEEPGLLQTSEELDIPLRVVSRSEIAACTKEFNKSDFVKEKIGVWAVCEPTAIIAGRKTKLILTKQKYAGVTIAVAQENFMW